MFPGKEDLLLLPGRQFDFCGMTDKNPVSMPNASEVPDLQESYFLQEKLFSVRKAVFW